MPALLIMANTLAGLAESVSIKRYNAKHDKDGFIFTAMISLFSMPFSA